MGQSPNPMPPPPYAHIPGANARHPEDLFDPVKELAPPETLDQNAAENQAWIYGLILIEQGFHWEAHEVLETVWMRAAPNSRERHLVQGIIHIANSALKHKMGRPEAAARLDVLAHQCIKEAYTGFGGDLLMGLDQTVVKNVLTKGTSGAIKLQNNAL